ncbi:MAG: isoprenoid biosynthesis glyoxalase ElbB [Planctomycetota bacterium]|jgi:enhancing lycopene biosynthesis protein 2
MSKKVAVVLSGCGFLDGAEIHESVLTLLFLDRGGAEVTCFAPDRQQMHVVDHCKGEPMDGETRNVLLESARIARGKIQDLSVADAAEFDAVIMPGGFGAAKNLSNFATAGADAEVDEDLLGFLRGMLEAKKPIGVVCISPAVLAAALRGTDVSATLTIGEDAGTASAIEAMGARHQNCPVNEFMVDDANMIVSTPAYMYDARISDVAAGIEKLVSSVLSLA